MAAESVWQREGESGLLDNYVLTIASSHFGILDNEKFRAKAGDAANNLRCWWVGTTDSLDVPTMEVGFSIGKNWTTKDGGLTIVHESGDPKKWFNKQVAYFKLLERLVQSKEAGGLGMLDILEGEGNDPRNAATWVGMIFRMHRELQPKLSNIPAAEQTDRFQEFPVEFLGRDGDAAATATGPTDSGNAGATAAAPTETAKEKALRIQAEKKKAAAAPAAASGERTYSDGLKGEVEKLFEGHDDFDTAQAVAFEMPGVMDDDDLLQSIMEESGLWSEVKTNA